jgi:hypothetical protein
VVKERICGKSVIFLDEVFIAHALSLQLCWTQPVPAYLQGLYFNTMHGLRSYLADLEISPLISGLAGSLASLPPWLFD